MPGNEDQMLIAQMSGIEEEDTKYHYIECGLDSVWLSNGFEIEKTPYGDALVIDDVPGLHESIAYALVEKTDHLTGAEFRFLRRELDWSQKLVGSLFEVDERTIRTWETREEGKVAVPGVNSMLIRHLYLEEQDVSSSYRELFERLRSLDRRRQEIVLRRTTAGAWTPATSTAA